MSPSCCRSLPLREPALLMPAACTFLPFGKFCMTVWSPPEACAFSRRTYREAFALGHGSVIRCLRSAPRSTAEIPISPTRPGADPNTPSRNPTNRGRTQSRKLFRREFASTAVELLARLCSDHGSPTTPTSVANPIVEKNFSKLVAAPKVEWLRSVGAEKLWANVCCREPKARSQISGGHRHLRVSPSV